MNKIYIIPLIALLGASCSSHHSGDEPLDTSGTAITLGVTTENTLGWEAATTSRSDEAPLNGRRTSAPLGIPRAGSTLAATTPETIGVFGYMTGATVFDNQPMYYTLGDAFTTAIASWPYASEWAYAPIQLWDNNTDYLFYAYAPWLPSSQVTASDDNLAGFQSLTISDLPLCGTEDYMVAQAMHAYTCTRASGNPHVPFTLEHLTARVRFCYRVAEEYAELRTVRLLSMTVTSPEGLYSITVDFSTGSQVISYVSDSRAGSPRAVSLLNDDGASYVDLNATEYQPLASLYVLPVEAPGAIPITITYDTLDKAGVTTRSGVVNSSQITISSTLQAGYYYDVNILIAPDYLYVLSDNDPTVDGYIIINE
ncbi:MAG: fimbrillin family protein [Bacteroidales bacterium]|nr:fimbrillin family protein [Bacteroidales bacterium]